MTEPDIDALVREVDEALPTLEWTPMPPVPEAPPGCTTTVFQGRAPGIGVMVLRWHQAGDDTSGYDGTAILRSCILHLTPELARKAFELAQQSRGG